MNAKNNIGDTPLHDAIDTLLHTAVMKDNINIEIVKLLLEKGAHVNAKDNSGKTAFESIQDQNIYNQLREHLKKIYNKITNGKKIMPTHIVSQKMNSLDSLAKQNVANLIVTHQGYSEENFNETFPPSLDEYKQKQQERREQQRTQEQTTQ